MHAGPYYSAKEILTWTRRETLIFLIWGSVPPTLAAIGCDFVVLPWPPIALLGTAVAFVTGFRGNAAYGRLWEARQIWGAIVNASRTWAVMIRDFVTDAAQGAEHRQFVLRHVAWLTALRHQLREQRAWETQNLPFNQEYRAHTFVIPERTATLEAELATLLSADELGAVLAKKNRATALLALQSFELRRVQRDGRVTEFRHVELMQLIANLIEQQGKCERIKNFPYPRQFATLNWFFVWLFILLLPFGVATEIKRVAADWLWFTVPVTVVVAWVFHTIDKIGGASENPFEGGPNDVPITAMSRAIEIDLRDLLNDTELPSPLAPSHNILL
ncbi:MAG TPA: bestrophin family ion channel [Polyangiales bacterium]|nr:bestrophin family ion channel [Polyangiales bacterium]